MKDICIRGLRLHNLKSIDLDLPQARLIVVTGPSGAGKSSLAMDSLYAEAQRRYIETFSPYVRQFLERLPPPPADRLDNLPAAVAISQANPVRNARSTLASLAELTFSVKQLFFRFAQLFCPVCGRKVEQHTPEHVLSEIVSYVRAHSPKGCHITVTIPQKRLTDAVSQGFFRGFDEHDGVFELEAGYGNGQAKFAEVLIDRIGLSSVDNQRLLEAAEQGFGMGDGRLAVRFTDGATIRFSRQRHCPDCDRFFSSPSVNLFSFNSPAGACPECHGFGRIMAVDWDMVVPDQSLSVINGAVKLLETWPEEKERLTKWCERNRIDPFLPWKMLKESDKQRIILGDFESSEGFDWDSEDWPGLQAYFDYLESKKYKAHIRMLLSRYRAFLTCPSCAGARFRQETGWYRLNGKNIAQLYAMSVSDARKWTEDFLSISQSDKVAAGLAQDIFYRLSMLERSGLGYLSLDRQSRTLSGGEVARIAIARAIGTELSNTLYVLDEPTTGLHPADTERLLSLVHDLKTRGNTVLVVEHDSQVVESADLVLVLGPASGEQGGRVVYFGDPTGFKSHRPAFAKAIEKKAFVSRVRVDAGDEGEYPCLRFENITANNLKGIDAAIEIGSWTVITGVSGSGKSTLLEEVIYRACLRAKGLQTEPPGRFERMNGTQWFQDIHFVDQEPVVKTPRACPVSYLKAFDVIRKLFSETDDARALGLLPGAFSFNSPAGRCETCEGQGVQLIEMQFLPDITIPCPACGGDRFAPRTLSVRYCGKNIRDILDMTMDDAAVFFHRFPKIIKPLDTARSLGLGYLRLGQPLSMLSGGESQRIKLARIISGLDSDRASLFLMDEPSRGLSAQEVELVCKALRRIAGTGHTVVTVEHDLNVILAADYVIDLGPGGGDAGGDVVFQGDVASLIGCEASLTGRALRRHLHACEAASGEDFRHDMERLTDFSRQEDNIPLNNQPLGIQDNVISIRGARHHNLKDISVDIPRDRFVVITGVSGSGKSTLAFDIVFSEGQRRYVEGLSSYMRQYIKMYERPDVDHISGLTPTVAIEQRTSHSGPMSTVATLTETANYIRLLYAKAASPICPGCARALQANSFEEIHDAIKELGRRKGNSPLFLLSRRVSRRKGTHLSVLEAASKQGIEMVRIDGSLKKIPPYPMLSRYAEHTIEWAYGPFSPDRFAGSGRWHSFEQILREALSAGKGEITALFEDGRQMHFSEHFACPVCELAVQLPDPLLFSFHTQSGKCKACDGAGKDQGGKTCADCQGTRLSPEARLWLVDGRSVADVFHLEVADCRSLLEGWLEKKPWQRRLDSIASGLVTNVLAKLSFLSDVGLGYLPLDRSGDSLSGGEAQRIRLAAQLGSGLTGITVVLDEPTIGLHPTDNKKLIRTLHRLRQEGNSVIVVEHDEEMLRSADWVIDMGQGGGRYGGEVIIQGTLGDVMKCSRSLTGKALSEKHKSFKAPEPGPEYSSFLSFNGISVNNIQGENVRIPLGALTCISGVSGSGKSTLLGQVILPVMQGILQGNPFNGLICKQVEGAEQVAHLRFVDHTPIGRTPRSCPATYLKVMDDIRSFMSQTPAARARGFGPSRFSFNQEGGQCPDCKGQGSQKVSLGMLPDVYIHCDTCGGRRYESATLDITWHGRNMADILAMTMEEAKDFFAPLPSLAKAFSVVCELGLGYLQLGQPSPTLSGGEAQRLKIARDIISPARGMTLYLLDEPTTGLHMLDVKRLVTHLRQLVEAGSTVIVIEHNLDVLSACDWIVELGPEGGKAGGKVLVSMSLADFIKNPVKTQTLIALEEYYFRFD